MNNDDFKVGYAAIHKRRFEKTISFVETILVDKSNVLDIGPVNPLSEIISNMGHIVTNTKSKDLDLDYSEVENGSVDVVTAFEILEHLVSPFPLLKAIKANKLVASIPLKLWFSSAYWSDSDPFDRHYHEFEPRQFDMLLEKAGWNIIKSDKWASYGKPNGIRPILRRFVPRYYIVYCERKQ